MKKIMILMMVLMTALAFAKGPTGSGEMIQERSEVQGLERAMIHAPNMEQVQKIEQVMERVREQHRERLGQLEDLTIEESDEYIDSYVAKGKTRARLKVFSFIKVNREVRYKITDSGELQYQKRFTDMFYRFRGDEN